MNPDKTEQLDSELSHKAEERLDLVLLKLEKICSAVYLVSSFMPEAEPLKWRLRDRAMNLFLKVSAKKEPLAYRLISFNEVMPLVSELLGLVVFALEGGSVSEMNFNILKKELMEAERALKDKNVEQLVTNLLPPLPLKNETPEVDDLSYKPQILSRVRVGKKNKLEGVSNINKKNDRRDLILSFVRQQGWSAIGDIASAVPGCGLKAVQRELADLVSTGLLKKKGDRRWSRYQLV